MARKEGVGERRVGSLRSADSNQCTQGASLHHFAAHQELTQHCKPTAFQQDKLENKVKPEKSHICALKKLADFANIL